MERGVMSTQIGEQLLRAQRRVRDPAAGWDRSSVTMVEPVARIALTRQDACGSLGANEESVVERACPRLNAVRSPGSAGSR